MVATAFGAAVWLLSSALPLHVADCRLDFLPAGCYVFHCSAADCVATWFTGWVAWTPPLFVGQRAYGLPGLPLLVLHVHSFSCYVRVPFCAFRYRVLRLLPADMAVHVADVCCCVLLDYVLIRVSPFTLVHRCVCSLRLPGYGVLVMPVHVCFRCVTLRCVSFPFVARFVAFLSPLLRSFCSFGVSRCVLRLPAFTFAVPLCCRLGTCRIGSHFLPPLRLRIACAALYRCVNITFTLRLR